LGQPKIVANSKGKRRRPGTKTLQQVLKAEDDQFVDFIAKCLTWDPERRLKPAAAMRHPWITNARKVSTSNPPPSVAIISRLSNITATPSRRSGGSENGKPRISEPSPLTARKTLSGLPASSSGNFANQSKTRPTQFNSSRSIAQVSRPLLIVRVLG
jgi:dual specificity tyrosine-phosphorylation-regulated kinase 2/3/4